MQVDNSTTLNDSRFFGKLTRYAKVAGTHVVRIALELYYAMKSPGTPSWAKAVIGGALAYFVLPVDAVPDFLPIAGYCDDLGALAAALATVRMYVTDEAKQLAHQRLAKWFGGKSTDAPTQSQSTSPA